MGLETGDYISDLNSANPDGATDQKSQGDDHLRLIKHILKTSFPNIDAAMNVSSADFNGFFNAGNLMLFQQTTAPTGWTKQTTHDDKALRIVSGTASSGGSSPFSTVFGKTATDSHTLTIAEMPSHNHGGSTGSAPNFITTGGSIGGATAGNDSYTTHTHSISAQGGDGGHTHNMDIRVNYVDVIIASKD